VTSVISNPALSDRSLKWNRSTIFFAECKSRYGAGPLRARTPHGEIFERCEATSPLESISAPAAVRSAFSWSWAIFAEKGFSAPHHEALGSVAAQSRMASEVLQRFTNATKHRWTIEDEERFQRETDAFL
jgi:hypothetical protein